MNIIVKSFISPSLHSTIKTENNVSYWEERLNLAFHLSPKNPMITMTFPNLNWYPNCMNWPWKERTDKGQFRLSSYWTARTITEPRFPRKKEKRKSSVFSSSNILGVNGNQFSITPLLPYAYSAKGLSQRFPSATKQGFQFFIFRPLLW